MSIFLITGPATTTGSPKTRPAVPFPFRGYTTAHLAPFKN